MAETAVLMARQPLSEAPHRINSQYSTSDQLVHKQQQQQQQQHHHHHRAGSSQPHAPRVVQDQGYGQEVGSPNKESPQPQEADDESRRLSQASYDSASSRSSKNYKTHIGPWQLGRTLGRGSSARVRLCRHNVTNQLAAVKIVNRRIAYLVQDSSLAALSKYDSSLPEVNGEMRVPMAIEREVAILKLIEHPNIMKLYDIWENRSEIYLILEYIDQGDLFTFINSKGRLSEEIAIYFFRQIISAIAYCHSFNVCHRDLKPENILITADLQIKIADFGMAALHQTDSHRLVTACGSPHYAAPELLKNKHYRGDRADIWSLGVILYAMLSASLPFDDPDLRVMMSKTKKGHFEMPKMLSPEAEDLIRRMLQVNPDRRITLKEIWAHPLIQKYGYLDDFGDISGQLPDTLKGFRYNPIARHEIDPQLLRQLQSMWHMFNEQELVTKLLSPEPNDQKAFYWLLHNYREKQLEDFKPELSHSMSDYHHLKPATWKRRVSTCQFTQPRANGHGRSISRFTVISNAAETEAGTVKSYDPFRGSRMLKTSNSRVSHAKITVHRDVQSGLVGQAMRSRRHSSYSSSAARRGRVQSSRTLSAARPRMSGSVSSFRSSSRPSGLRTQGPILRHKRGVDFSHVRKRSASATPLRIGSRRSLNTVPVVRNHERSTRSITPEMPRLASVPFPKAKRPSTVEEVSRLFNEELRHFSHNIAKDCDKAFQTSMIDVHSISGSLHDGDRSQRDSTPFSFEVKTPSEATMPTEVSNRSWSSRPLPPLPSDDGSPPSRQATTRSYGKTGHASAMLPRQADRRVVSAPAQSHVNKRQGPLPSILENGDVMEKSRIVSAPPYAYVRKANAESGAIQCLTRVHNSIRLVNPPIGQHPVEIPEPLNVRKKVAPREEAGSVDHHKTLHDQRGYNEDEQSGSDPHTKSRMKSWFKLSFKSGSEDGTGARSIQDQRPWAVTRQNSSTDVTSDGSKRRHFSFSFWKSNRERDSRMMIERDDRNGSGEHQDVALRNKAQKQGLQKSASNGSRNIEVKQNWFARLFRVKPATGYICLTLSRKRARQEVAILLKEWRKYGMRGVQVDKERNIVFARVGARNHLNLKKVSFAAEVMAVIEHGKKQPLSIVRFTQERGAASSFHKVVDTMRIVFASRNLLVAERNKQKMMIKTLNSESGMDEELE